MFFKVKAALPAAKPEAVLHAPLRKEKEDWKQQKDLYAV
jgi:hypothetical protein